MSVFNDEIDLEVLEFALKRYADRIPKTELQTLQTYIQAWKQEQPNSAQTLCRFVFESAEIDVAYDHALTDIRRQYKTQQKAKSAILTTQSSNTLDGLGAIADELLQQLDRLLNPQQITHQTIPWENADRMAVMASGGAFLGGAIVQLFGGGVVQLVGAVLGAIVGLLSSWYVNKTSTEPGQKS